jgi:sodium transport system permease protein
MRNILTIMRKEFKRFFYDRRMIMTAMLPAILIYLVYSFMGTAMQRAFSPDDEAMMIYSVGMPDSIMSMTREAGLSVWDIGYNTDALFTENIKERITNQTAHVLVIFPESFQEKVDEFDVQAAGGAPAPNVEVYFNSVNTTSSHAYMRLVSILDNYEASLTNKFDINMGIENADLSTQEDRTATMISSLMPMLLMIFLYSGCMGLALESITGEKERGTLATLLVSPLGRSELAIGKILSLAALSFLIGAASALATILALPNLMAVSDEAMDAVNIYGASDYAMLALVILSTLLLLVTVISIISAFAKTVKEASASAMPMMIVVMLVSVTGMFGTGAREGMAFYLVPIYSSVQSMTGIFSLDYSVTNIIISCLSNLAYACIGGFILTRMFNNEKIMFSR